MPDPESAPAGSTEPAAVPAGRSNLMLRVLSSLVMIPLAIGAAWWGGWPFALVWTAACGLVLGEWVTLVRRGGPAAAGSPGSIRTWMLAGVVYAGAILAATLLLRSDAVAGLAAILFLFAVVWTTDIAAYFAGRAFGGPKLMPRVSPKKTWSGAAGGTLAGVVAGVAVGAAFGFGGIVALAVVALLLSLVSQAGDLAESAMKRHFDVKDSSGLIPGHGGLMDRLDGYAAAAIAAALIGVLRGGLDAPARGLLLW